MLEFYFTLVSIFAVHMIYYGGVEDINNTSPYEIFVGIMCGFAWPLIVLILIIVIIMMIFDKEL